MRRSTPQVMGILNVTSDSFFDGGRYCAMEQAERHVAQMVEDGVDLIDVGACSTRPGASPRSAQEEITALEGILRSIRSHHPHLPISIDTYRAEVAQWAFDEYQVEIINDISGGTLDSAMFECIARTGCTYVLTHTRGTPETMQQQTHYKNLMQEVMVFLAERKNLLRKLGVQNIIVDPGFGFAKTLEQNYELLRKLDYFELLELPILVGISRKSMIQKVLGRDAAQSLNGSSILNTIALLNGASLLRVHDVREAKECIKLITQYETSN